ncbi:DUF3040 domain-containing protein [Kribbella qitaiheensis]|uniref:DUF3040 domain-containing protein n=1 Tax=Kribbella qitaiheensis TaxID=1544730 RepID=UPI003617D196
MFATVGKPASPKLNATRPACCQLRPSHVRGDIPLTRDAEQRQLAEIESGLRRDDTAFVRHFDKRSLTPRRRHVGAKLAILVVSAVPAVARVLGGCRDGSHRAIRHRQHRYLIGLWRCRAQQGGRDDPPASHYQIGNTAQSV